MKHSISLAREDKEYRLLLRLPTLGTGYTCIINFANLRSNDTVISDLVSQAMTEIEQRLISLFRIAINNIHIEESKYNLCGINQDPFSLRWQTVLEAESYYEVFQIELRDGDLITANRLALDRNERSMEKSSERTLRIDRSITIMLDTLSRNYMALVEDTLLKNVQQEIKTYAAHLLTNTVDIYW